MTIKTLPLVPEEFIGKASQSAYWENIPSEIFRNNWGKLISGTDVPLSPEKFANGFKNIVIKESKEGTNDAANLLLQEAVTNKKWSIPPHAPVELTIGPFSHFELTEQGNSVVAVGRTSSGEFTVFHVWPKQGAILIPTSFLERLEKRDLVEACLKLLLSAIIRDFWVVEQRETVFHTTEVKRLPWRKESPSDDPAIVYIPRVRYSSPSVRQCSEGLEHTLRRAHFVTGHLRKADTPSERQILIAQRYGIDVAQGYTFVKPHERGRHKREVIYRSRSALRMLYQERILQGEGKSRWFEFERDVYDLMRSIGFEVEHCAASHRGDRGVDVFATKGTDLEEINWIIQCKCFGPKRKVGPNIVRDLIGAIGQFKKGTRGMIVTTSSFTEEATKLALSEGIRLIDGIEFSKMIETAKGSQGTP
jgi:Holliday junction resolvase